MTRLNGSIAYTMTDERVTVTFPGMSVSSGGGSPREALGNALRGLADALDKAGARAPEELDDEDVTYIRVSAEVDIPVSAGTALWFASQEAAADEGNQEAAAKCSEAAMGWLAAALLKHAPSRSSDLVDEPSFISLDWCSVDDADEVAEG
jgi:hypothetical protein